MKLSSQTMLEVPRQFAFNWHTQPNALQRLLPPWEKIRIVQQTGEVTDGRRVTSVVPLVAGLRTELLTEYRIIEPDYKFEEMWLKGPFANWCHTHIFESITDTSCRLIDDIEYSVPFGKAGRALREPFVQKKLRAWLTYRHRQSKTEMELHYQYHHKKRLRILVSGSTGIIGESLCSFLSTGGHEVIRLVRSEKLASQDPQTVFWDPDHGEVDRNSLESFDAVIHLGGANIAHHKWDSAYKKKIKRSRVHSTQLLAALLATLQEKPSVFIVASAIGYYGDRGDEIMTEESESGTGFLPQLVREWEQAAEPAQRAGIRVVHPRIGVVLTPVGAALGSMLPLFRCGLGGVAGNGKQYWSSISIHDVIGAIHFMLMNETVEEAVNVVSPEPLTNREFTKTLGKVLRRPTLLPMPAPLIKLFLGEMGEALLLESTRVVPKKLLSAGYKFQQETLEDALRHLLGRSKL